MARSNKKNSSSSPVTRKSVLGNNPFGSTSPVSTNDGVSRENSDKSGGAPPASKSALSSATPSRPPSRRCSKASQEPQQEPSAPSVEQPIQALSEPPVARQSPSNDSVAAAPVPEPERSVPRPIERPGGNAGGMADTARDLFSSDYYLRQWGRLGMRMRSEVVDDFGFDPTYEAKVRPLLEVLYRRYFRASVQGIDNVPSEGRALIVANHSGTFPYDGLMLKTALRIDHPADRPLRWLTEDFVFYFPFAGSFMNRLGAVRACPENAERLFSQEKLVSVFPEGAKGTGRLYRDRYKLQRFGRGGFVRLCLKTQTPVIPCAIIGAEESMPLLHKVELFSKVLGLPYIPITPTFPALGALGLVPAPTRWFFHFGEPIALDCYGPDAADDSVLVGRLTERIRATIQNMVDKSIKSRRSVWFG